MRLRRIRFIHVLRVSSPRELRTTTDFNQNITCAHEMPSIKGTWRITIIVVITSFLQTTGVHNKGKGKGQPLPSHEGPASEHRYSSILSSNSELYEWVVSVTPRPFTPGKDPVPVVQKAGCASGPVWTGTENLALTRVRSSERPGIKESLYQQSYPGPQVFIMFKKKSLKGEPNF